MTATHRLSSQVFTALARGGGGLAAVRWLASVQNSRNRLLLHMLAEAANETDGTTTIVREAYRTIISLERNTPRAVDFVVNYPAVSAWLLSTATHLHRGKISAAQPAWLAAVAAAAAIRAAVTTTVDIPEQSRVGAVVQLPSLGAASLPAGPVQLSVSPNVVVLAAGGEHVAVPSVPHQEGKNWRGLRRVAAEHAGLRLDLLIDGWGPGRIRGAVVIGQDELDPREIGRWRTVLSAGWRLLVTHHRAIATEVAAVHRMLVPLRAAGPGHISATPSDAFGCVAMSLPPDPQTAALTLAHEVQHAKLSVLADVFPLVKRTGKQEFYAPWRTDPRPPAALLQGIYAHLGVTAFWRDQRYVAHNTIKAEVEFARWRTATHEAAQTLMGSGLLTPVGTQFVAGILEVLEGWRSETVSAAATTAARRLAQRHRDQWPFAGNDPPAPTITAGRRARRPGDPAPRTQGPELDISRHTE